MNQRFLVSHTFLVILLFAGVELNVPTTCCYSQTVPSGSRGDSTGAQADEAPDLAAIRHGSVEFIEAFNRGDAKAIAEMWTPEGEYVDHLGRGYFGRDEIEKAYAALFADNPNGKLRLTIDSLRLISKDVAVEDGRAALESSTAAPPTQSRYSAVHVRNDGKWLLASVRDADSNTAVVKDDLADFQWLIGTWIAEEHGVKTESTCRWICNQSFVERKYRAIGVDGGETTGVQVIGWNAQDSHVQSWNFAPDGGTATGIWMPIEGGWQATVNGVTSEGLPTLAVNVLQRLDDDAYVWQSTQRLHGETPLPDTEEVIFRRQITK